MSITLKSEVEQIIQQKLQSGKYQTADDVILEALQLLEQRDKNHEQWLEETREKIAVGLAQADRGEVIDANTVIERLQEKFQKAREAQQ